MTATPNPLPVKDGEQVVMKNVMLTVIRGAQSRTTSGSSALALTLQSVEAQERPSACSSEDRQPPGVDGRDPWSELTARAGLVCRLFATPAGLACASSVQQVVAALLDTSI